MVTRVFPSFRVFRVFCG